MYLSWACSAVTPSSTSFCQAPFFALPCSYTWVSIGRLAERGCGKRCTDLEIEHAGGGSLGDVLAVADLEET